MEVGDPVMVRGGNTPAATWVKKCGGARNWKAITLMRLLGILMVLSSWHDIVIHVTGVDNVLTDAGQRWSPVKIGNQLAECTNDTLWTEIDLGDNRDEMCRVVSSESEWTDDSEANLWLKIGGEPRVIPNDRSPACAKNRAPVQRPKLQCHRWGDRKGTNGTRRISWGWIRRVLGGGIYGEHSRYQHPTRFLSKAMDGMTEVR